MLGIVCRHQHTRLQQYRSRQEHGCERIYEKTQTTSGDASDSATKAQLKKEPNHHQQTIPVKCAQPSPPTARPLWREKTTTLMNDFSLLYAKQATYNAPPFPPPELFMPSDTTPKPLQNSAIAPQTSSTPRTNSLSTFYELLGHPIRADTHASRGSNFAHTNINKHTNSRDEHLPALLSSPAVPPQQS